MSGSPDELEGGRTLRALLALAGAAMMAFAAVTMVHFFEAAYPASLADAVFCTGDPSSPCARVARSPAASVFGIPIAWPGIALGGLVVATGLIASPRLTRTTRPLLAVNLVLTLLLLVYGSVILGALCSICLGWVASSVAAFAFAWLLGAASWDAPGWRRWTPSLPHLAVFGMAALVGGWLVHLYDGALERARSGGDASRVVAEFFALPPVPWPSEISPHWTVKSTDRFDEASIRVVEYADPLCPDCRLLHEQLEVLRDEFAGELNVAFQFFPLDAACNDVVEKDKHPGACDLSYALAGAGEDFPERIAEVFEDLDVARDPSWRDDFLTRHGLRWAVADPGIRDRVHRLIRTGAEYEPTDARFEHGIRSTPTMIVNNRMVIGTLPVEHLRAIFRALVDEGRPGGGRFIERWEELSGG